MSLSNSQEARLELLLAELRKDGVEGQVILCADLDSEPWENEGGACVTDAAPSTREVSD